MARVGKDFSNAFAFAAGQFGITVEAAQKTIQKNMVPGWPPANWRDRRLI